MSEWSRDFSTEVSGGFTHLTEFPPGNRAVATIGLEARAPHLSVLASKLLG